MFEYSKIRSRLWLIQLISTGVTTNSGLYNWWKLRLKLPLFCNWEENGSKMSFVLWISFKIGCFHHNEVQYFYFIDEFSNRKYTADWDLNRSFSQNLFKTELCLLKSNKMRFYYLFKSSKAAQVIMERNWIASNGP